MKIRKLTLAALTTATLSVTLYVQAADGPHDDAIEARQALMKLQNYNVGLLFAMAKEKIPYDPDVAAEAANNLDALVNLGQSQLWPAGSDSATEGNATNRALPAIWETYPKIVEKSEALTSAVAALVPVAGNGLEAMQDAVGDVGGTCKSCHDDFREER
ncbi:MAG: cytochrome c [Granulosicoccus sp.]|nr:cytochrome c [Granulosicoccus sp.]